MSTIWILDIRSEDQFNRGPWLHSARRVEAEQQQEQNTQTRHATEKKSRLCRIPLPQLAERCFMLPPKRTELILVCDCGSSCDENENQNNNNNNNNLQPIHQAQTQAVLNLFVDPKTSWPMVDSVCAPTFDAEIDSSSPFQVFFQESIFTQKTTTSTTREDQEPKATESGNSNAAAETTTTTRTMIEYRWTLAAPTAAELSQRSWDATPIVERFVPRIFCSDINNSSETTTKITRFALDIGCGSGRDVAFLLSSFQSTAHEGVGDNFVIFALDNRRKLLNNTMTLAADAAACRSSSGVRDDDDDVFVAAAAAAGGGAVAGTENVSRSSSSSLPSSRVVPLEATVTSTLPFREGTFDLIIVVRFLERQLLRNLARYLSPRGGVLIYSHFVDGCQHTEKGTPSKPSQFLLHGELKRACVELAVLPQRSGHEECGGGEDENSWLEIIHDAESVLNDGTMRPIAELVVRRVR